MEIRHLKTFVIVAEAGNFSLAAQRSSLTQSAVSQQVKALERTLGTSLFKRTSHSVQLTEAGRALLPKAKAALQALDDCRTSVDEVEGLLRGELNIGIGSFVAPYIETAAARFMSLHPGIRVNAIFAQARQLNHMLRNQDIDMAFTINTAYINEPIESVPCISYHLRAIMNHSHPLASHDVVTKHDLLTHDIILPDAGQRVFDSISKFISIDFASLRIRATVTDATAAMTMANDLGLITFLPELYVRTRPYLTALPIEGLLSPLISNVHFLKDCPHKKSADAFLTLVKDYSIPLLSCL